MPRSRNTPWPSVLAVTFILVAGCATEPEHGHGRGGRFEGRRGGDGERWREGARLRPGLFISPAGEPFRSAPGEPYPSAGWFAGADLDHDGRLTRSEFRQDAERFFTRIDLNHDGVLDSAEIANYERTVAPEILPANSGEGPAGGPQARSWPGGGGEGGGGRRGGHGGGRSGGMGRGPGGGSGGAGGGGVQRSPRQMMQGAMPFSLIPQAEPVSAADTDFDGKVTRAEFIASADRHFATLDTSGAGALTLAGLPQTPMQARRERGRGAPT